MATDRGSCLTVPAAAALLLWPALWNGYPIVFADTGTYLSQAVHLYAGWDRPVFYSLLILPLHATITLWPVVVAQALIVASVLWACSRDLLSGGLFLALVAALSATTWLPWLVSEIMPDLFTPLLVLAIWLLTMRWRLWIAGLMAMAVATQLSSVPLAVGLAVIAVGASRVKPGRGRCGTGSAPLCRRYRLAVPIAVSIAALCTANMIAHGRFTISPFGNVFLLARMIADGPAATALHAECPAAGWRLCRFTAELPMSADAFLWDPGSPLARAGGAKSISAEAGAIIGAALRAKPEAAASAAIRNTVLQVTHFDSGDGLDPWPREVSPWINHDFPAREQAAYHAARQQIGSLRVPFGWLHRVSGIAGVLACLIQLPHARRRAADVALLLIVVLAALPLNAAITGALSGPHDRYQARLMWLPPFAAILTATSLLRRRPA